MPGELVVAKEPLTVWTVLGSCLALTFYNRRLKVGAICHAQLPAENMSEDKCYEGCPVRCYKDLPPSNKFKYVTCSFKYMLDEFRKLEINKNEIEVKMFGGADVLSINTNNTTVGKKNIAVAKNLIEKSGLQLVADRIGGGGGVSLFFDTYTGNVYLKDYNKTENRLPPQSFP